jgi:peroxiredoxin
MIGAGAALLFFAVFSLGKGYFLGTDSGVSELQNSSGSPVVGEPAPDFVLKNLNGEQVRLSDQKGKVVLINFWATWCGPCIVEMPMFQDFYDIHKDQLEILALNNMEDKPKVANFVDDNNLSFPVLLDSQADVALQYLVRAFPTSYLIDAEGIVRFQHIGFMTEGQFVDYMTQLGIES